MSRRRMFVMVALVVAAVGAPAPGGALPPIGPNTMTVSVLPSATLKESGGLAAVVVSITTRKVVEVPLPGEYVSFFCSATTTAPNVDPQGGPVPNSSCADLGVRFLSAAGLNEGGPSAGGFTSTGDGFTSAAGAYATVLQASAVSPGLSLPRVVYVTARDCDEPPVIPNLPPPVGEFLNSTTCYPAKTFAVTLTA